MNLSPLIILSVVATIGILLFFRRAFRCAKCGKQTKPWRRLPDSVRNDLGKLIPDEQKPFLENRNIRICPYCGTLNLTAVEPKLPNAPRTTGLAYTVSEDKFITRMFGKHK